MILNERNRSYSKCANSRKREEVRRRKAQAADREMRGVCSMSKRNLRPITLGLVVGSREFFNGAPALETRRQLIAQLDKLKVAYQHPAGRGDEERGGAVARGRAPLRGAFSRAARNDRRAGDLPAELRRRDRDLRARQRGAARRSDPAPGQQRRNRQGRRRRAAATPSAASSPSPTISINTACRSPTRRATPATSTARNSPPISTGSPESAAWCAA